MPSQFCRIVRLKQGGKSAACSAGESERALCAALQCGNDDNQRASDCSLVCGTKFDLVFHQSLLCKIFKS